MEFEKQSSRARHGIYDMVQKFKDPLDINYSAVQKSLHTMPFIKDQHKQRFAIQPESHESRLFENASPSIKAKILAAREVQDKVN